MELLPTDKGNYVGGINMCIFFHLLYLLRFFRMCDAVSTNYLFFLPGIDSVEW